jgi:hypothetical protein
VPAFRIIEALDVVEYISSRLISGPVRLPSALDMNYRGSTGHGRGYRDCLQLNWGVFVNLPLTTVISDTPLCCDSSSCDQPSKGG